MTGTVVALFILAGIIWFCAWLYRTEIKPEMPQRQPKPPVVPPEDTDGWGDYVGGGRQ